MHDVHRDSIISHGRKKKVSRKSQTHSHDDEHKHASKDKHSHNHKSTVHDHGHDHEHDSHHHDHDHSHDHNHTHHHDHGVPHGHDHDDSAFEEHHHDDHVHNYTHDGQSFEDRAFAHAHEHGHNLYHAHHHTHHPEHVSVIHRIFRDPMRDWFGAALMGLLIVVGYLKLLPGSLSDGMLLCAAVIGIFPVLKNALYDCIARRSISFELLLGVLLLGGLVAGRFLEVALAALFLLIGSFMRLNFSWKD